MRAKEGNFWVFKGQSCENFREVQNSWVGDRRDSGPHINFRVGVNRYLGTSSCPHLLFKSTVLAQRHLVPTYLLQIYYRDIQVDHHGRRDII